MIFMIAFYADREVVYTADKLFTNVFICLKRPQLYDFF